MQFLAKIVNALNIYSFVSLVNGYNYSEVERLNEFIFKKLPSVYMRPVKDQTKEVNVTVSMAVVSLSEINAVHQTVTFSGVVMFKWQNEFISWSPGDHSGIKEIFVKTTKLWTPRVTISNIYSLASLVEQLKYFTIESTGSVRTHVSGVFTVPCNVDITKFPFDVQYCNITMEPFDFSLDSPNVEEDTGSSVREHSLSSNGEWEIEWKDHHRVKGLGGVRLTSVDYVCQFTRKSRFYINLIIIPMSLISAINVFTFLIPVKADRLAIGVPVILSYTFYFGVISDSVPRVSGSTSILIVYLNLILALSVLSTILSVLQIKFMKDLSDAPPVESTDSTKNISAENEAETTLLDVNPEPQSQKQNMTIQERIQYREEGIIEFFNTYCTKRKFVKNLNTILFLSMLIATLLVSIICFGMMLS